MEKVVFDYYNAHYLQDHLKLLEKALKNVYNVKQITVRIITDAVSFEAVKLLRMNLIEHHNLFSFRLKNITIITRNLDSKICKPSILRDFVKHLEEIEIIPFAGYKLDDRVVDFCKRNMMEVVAEALKSNIYLI